MKAYLMFKDRDFDAGKHPAFDQAPIVSDLELTTLLATMAQGDEIIRQSSQSALLMGLHSREEILYRQDILKDCIRHPSIVRNIYTLTIETLEKQKKGWWWFGKGRPLTSLFSNAVDSLTMLTGMVKELRTIADQSVGMFSSTGLTTLFSMLQKELDDNYFAQIRKHLAEIKFRDGMLISARLGNFNQGIQYVLRRRNKKGFWRRWSFAPSFTLAPRDDAGGEDFNRRKERAINDAANILIQSAEHVIGFFTMLRNEIAFYIGCLNLHDTLKSIHAPVCFACPLESGIRKREIQGLYDVSLALKKRAAVTGNNLSSSNRSLYIITGANQGGKSTFVRSIGQSQLMMQCGLFVAAEAYSAHMCNGVFTHFKKEEDASLTSGKLDEELSRMSDIADYLRLGALVLFNESFSATNEREGSEIGRQVTDALIDNGVEVFSVTHLYAFAAGYYEKTMPDVTFLCAERKEDGHRTFRIVEGQPSQTGFGDDLYQTIFANVNERSTRK